MIGVKTVMLIGEAVKAEYECCVEEYGAFKNWHEAWAVLKEEIEEVQECFKPFEFTAESNMDMLWDDIRADDVRAEIIDDQMSVSQISNIEDITFEIMEECAQVLAMCRKSKDLLVREQKLDADINR